MPFADTFRPVIRATLKKAMGMLLPRTDEVVDAEADGIVHHHRHCVYSLFTTASMVSLTCVASERASEPTRTERAGAAARERACRGVRWREATSDQSYDTSETACAPRPAN